MLRICSGAFLKRAVVFCLTSKHNMNLSKKHFSNDPVFLKSVPGLYFVITYFYNVSSSEPPSTPQTSVI